MKAIAAIMSCVVVLAAASSAPATLMIDSFDEDSGFMFVWDTWPSESVFLDGLDPSQVIGGSRDAALAWVSGPSRTYADVNFGGSGTLDFAQGPHTVAQLTLIWDGDSTAGLTAYDLATDLTDGGNNTGLIAKVLSLDLPLNIEVTVYTDAGNWSHSAGVFPGGTSGPQYLAFNDPSWTHTGAGADFTNVGAIKIVIGGAGYPDSDLRVDYFAAGVPEPSSVAMAAVALAGLGLFWLRRRRRA